jgi:hypothetical protein
LVTAPIHNNIPEFQIIQTKPMSWKTHRSNRLLPLWDLRSVKAVNAPQNQNSNKSSHVLFWPLILSLSPSLPSTWQQRFVIQIHHCKHCYASCTFVGSIHSNPASKKQLDD